MTNIKDVIGNIGGRPPYGYQYSSDKTNWIVNKFERNNLLAIFKMAIEGKTLSSIARELNKRKLTSWSGKDWSYKTISYLFTTKRILIYAGIHDGMKVEEWEPIIDEDTAKKLIEKNIVKTSKPRPRANNYLFSGNIATCAHCGGPIRTNKTKSKNNYYLYYFCTHRSMYGADHCPNSNLISQETPNNIFYTDLPTKIANIEYYKKIYTKYLKLNRSDVQEKIIRLDTMIVNANNKLSKSDNHDKTENILIEINHLLKEKTELLSSTYSGFDFNEFISDCKDFKSKPMESQVDLLKKYFQVSLHQEYISITYPFPINEKLDFTIKLEYGEL
ncbi:MAG: recombinase family protein [Bacteroidetes bacterium]|nr:recombinase family protein [Bacteroidota bacterium]